VADETRDDAPPDEETATELTIDVQSLGRGGIRTLVARLGSHVVHSDKIDPLKAADRRKFAATVASNCPALEAADIEAQILDRFGARSTRD
jgi:hypothetical protein